MQDQPKQKWVAVFGAGITGLTAAHELIERGYGVEVFESEGPSPYDTECTIGGMAATQWVRVEHLARLNVLNAIQGADAVGGARDGTSPPDLTFVPTEPLPQGSVEDILAQMTIPFRKGSAVLDRNAKKILDSFAGQLKGCTLRIEVRGYTDRRDALPFSDPAKNGREKQQDDLQRANAVCAYLAQHGVDKRILEPVNYGLGHRDDWTKSDDDRCYVDFRTLEDWIPGEHGFRFFPAFYRNLRDTMARTPIAEDTEEFIETPWTVEDNVIPTVSQGINPEGGCSYVLPRERIQSVQQMFDVLCNSLAGSRYTFKDLALIQVKLFKYITSCAARRQDYEDLSWWEFVEGERYSEAFRTYLDKIPQNLVAMNAKECDARTYGNIQTQILLGQFTGGSKTDGTLNGPTTLAWLKHWRRYLESQGVIFRNATLTGFENGPQNTVWPRVHVPDDAEGHDEIIVRDYYVVAISLEEIHQLLTAHPEMNEDDFDRIRAMQLGEATCAKPDGVLQHMSGIQYYLLADMKLLRGHIVYPDSEWGLSSIYQTQFWMRKRGWWDGYHGVLSVDISDWHTPSRHLGKSAWECTRTEIAHEVWRQIKATLKEEEKKKLPKYVHYHLDECIAFDRRSGSRKLPSGNDDRMLITLKGRYRQRPGTPGKYAVHCGNLVLAGTYMQTYFRLTTMEAANESARHAVNAILNHDNFRGDHCEIMNPEDCEFGDLKYFVDLDQALHDQGLPHLVDILGLDQVPGSWFNGPPDLTALGLSFLCRA